MHYPVWKLQSSGTCLRQSIIRTKDEINTCVCLYSEVYFFLLSSLLFLPSSTKVKVSRNRTERPEGRRINPLFLDLGTIRGWVVSTTPRPLYTRKRHGTHCTGGWVEPRAGLGGCEKSPPNRDSIIGPSSPWLGPLLPLTL
jgi:hypothetical protein